MARADARTAPILIHLSVSRHLFLNKKCLICEALRANPEGLRTQDILKWLEKSRPEAFLDLPRDKSKASLQATLSAQANKKDPKLWRYEVEGSKQLGFVWTLSSKSTVAHHSIAATGLDTGVVGQNTFSIGHENANESNARQEMPSADDLDEEGDASACVDKMEEEIRSSALAPHCNLQDSTQAPTQNSSEHDCDIASPDVDELKKRLAKLQAKAEEQERIAKQAHLESEAARNAVEVATATQNELALAKRKLENLDQEIQQSRKKLKIDDDQ
ncbi:hypothetical protein CBER1_11636 [Cercospora berteroae]|uniref:Uncharacterized protein n=1 Tax=Cercospora berteroae TaxID=357750 RepID=A0A2S6CM95_9PEZI|nr:hypothetical protein CBER1_11636 [Cercospora berteroae]